MAKSLENGGLMDIYPLRMSKQLLKIAIETVDFTLENGEFPVRYVCLPEGTSYESTRISSSYWEHLGTIVPSGHSMSQHVIAGHYGSPLGPVWQQTLPACLAEFDDVKKKITH